MTGKLVAYYYEGRNTSGKLIVTNGHKDSPNLILLMDEDAYREMKQRDRFPTVEEGLRSQGRRNR